MFKKIISTLVITSLFYTNSLQAMRRTSSMEDMDGPPKPKIHIATPAPHENGPEDQPAMKFKLGFEFQESSGLCPWALNNKTLQKVSLFGIKDNANQRRLWKIVIDSNDIEFVTEPFTFNERRLLKTCIKSILNSLKLLKESLVVHPSISFEEWTDKMEGIVRGTSFSVMYFGSYELVQDKNLVIKPSTESWSPRFSPQATIQHPLEYAIPLYFGLFGFESAYMFSFTASLPFRDLYLAAQAAADSRKFKSIIHGYKQKATGLAFLHALTLTHMSPDEENSDNDLLRETQRSLIESGQVDAKLKLPIMSRLPFSLMCKSIRLTGRYREFFQGALGTNFGFRDIPSLFRKANYAEQYFDEEGVPRDLSYFLDYFREDFLLENKDVIVDLLKQGVVSTTMIRNFKEDTDITNIVYNGTLFDNFFNLAICTVDLPEKTYIIDLEGGTVKSIPWLHDTLSPPCFLDHDNSMGRFREDMTKEDQTYGEAIVEIRGIRNVQSWFLKKCGLKSEFCNNFLTNPTSLLKEEAIALFDFLNNFGSSSDDEEIFYLGIPSAIHKFKMRDERK